MLCNSAIDFYFSSYTHFFNPLCLVNSGHQKKIMLAIDRLKRINGSLRRLSGNKQSNVPTESPYPRYMQRHQPSHDNNCVSSPLPPKSSSSVVQPVSPTQHYNGLGPPTAAQVSVYDNVTPRSTGSGAGGLSTFMTSPPPPTTPGLLYQRQLDPVAELPVVDHDEMSTYPSIVGHQAVIVGTRGPESDGDVTPTNERRFPPSRPVDEFSQGANVVTRPAAYVVPSPKPVAMVTAKADLTVDPWQSARSNSVSGSAQKSSGTNFSYGTLPRKFSQKRQLAVSNGDGEESYNLVGCGDSTYESKSPTSHLSLERPKERLQIDANSNCHVVKKEPPVPPKRTHSFKTDLRMPIAAHMRGMSNNVPRATSNGESFKPATAGSTDLFGGAENILSEVIERLERSTTTTTSGSGSSTVRRNTGPRLGDWQDGRLSNDSGSGSEDSDSGLDSRRSDSNTSLDCSGGSSTLGSTDMNTLPFANENVGTIKQRGSSSSKPSVVTTSDSGAVQLDSSVFTPTPNSSSASVTANVS